MAHYLLLIHTHTTRPQHTKRRLGKQKQKQHDRQTRMEIHLVVYTLIYILHVLDNFAFSLVVQMRALYGVVLASYGLISEINHYNHIYVLQFSSLILGISMHIISGLQADILLDILIF